MPRIHLRTLQSRNSASPNRKHKPKPCSVSRCRRMISCGAGSSIHSSNTLSVDSSLSSSPVDRECLMSDKKDSSIANVEHFISTSGSRSATEVRKIGYDLKQQGHYFQAMILYKISHDLHKKEKKFSPDEELEWISNRVLGINYAITPMAKEGGTSRDIAINYGLKYMTDMLTEVREIKNATPDIKALNELGCLISVADIYDELGEYGKAIELGEEGITMMKEQFKEKVSNYKYYGWLLNNLGYAYHNSGQHSKAEHCFVTAIEVKERALDYENEKKRQKGIEKTKRRLESVRRDLAKQK